MRRAQPVEKNYAGRGPACWVDVGHNRPAFDLTAAENRHKNEVQWLESFFQMIMDLGEKIARSKIKAS
jgi:hypothetical protein